MAEANPIKEPPTTRRCCYCKKRKPFADFAKNRFKKWGVQVYCRDCGRERARVQIKAYRERNPDYEKAKRFTKYGMTSSDYDAMLKAQGGSCAICGDPADGMSLHIDHCHASGRVRGLLCRPCNHALGLFRDNPENMRRAADYVGT